jgi:polysaccharide export outer membrane protein
MRNYAGPLMFMFTLFLNISLAQDAPDRYKLHAGDVVEIVYRFTPQFNQTVTLAPDGHAGLTIAGDLALGGLTLEEATKRILEAVSSTLNAPELTVVLKEFQKPFVVVSGEVQAPGKIEMRKEITAIQALMLAGGLKSSAKASHVMLYRHLDRSDRSVVLLNLSSLKASKDLNRDIQLQPDDILFVTTDSLQKIDRFMHAFNLGLYFDPLQF